MRNIKYARSVGGWWESRKYGIRNLVEWMTVMSVIIEREKARGNTFLSCDAVATSAKPMKGDSCIILPFSF